MQVESVLILNFAESASSRSSGLLAPPQLQGEQNAYIPYIYAKECIQRVCLSFHFHLFHAYAIILA